MGGGIKMKNTTFDFDTVRRDAVDAKTVLSGREFSAKCGKVVLGFASFASLASVAAIAWAAYTVVQDTPKDGIDCVLRGGSPYACNLRFSK